MTTSPLVAAIEAAAEAHRSRSLTKRARLIVMRVQYVEITAALQRQLVELEAEIAAESDNERQAWADARSAKATERMRRAG